MLDMRVILDPLDDAHLHAQPLVMLWLCSTTIEINGWVVHFLMMNICERLGRIVLVAIVLREHHGRGWKLLSRTLEDILEYAALQVIKQYDNVLFTMGRVYAQQRDVRGRA